MSLTKLLMGIIFVMLASACATVVTKGIVDANGQLAKLISYPAPAIYETWWQEIADCEQLPLPADHKVQWRIVTVRPFYLAEDSTHRKLDAMIVTTDSVTTGYINYTGILDRGLVEHEMAHSLLFKQYGKTYVGQHPDPYYTRCGLVAAGQQRTK